MKAEKTRVKYGSLVEIISFSCPNGLTAFQLVIPRGLVTGCFIFKVS